MRRAGRVVAAVLAVAGLSACTAESSVAATPPTAPSAGSSTPAPPAGPIPPLPEVGEVPVAHDGGYTAAADQFGADRVTAAVRSSAQLAHVALADCHRWTTGEVDPRLTTLVAPELLTRALDELARSKEYGGSPVPSLLSHLPTDDGNGMNEAAAVAGGCDDSAPLRFPTGPVRIRVHKGGDHPGLQITGAYVTEVAFGSTRVGAGQDWTFLASPTADGWLVSDASVSGNVNWFPAPAQTATS